MDSFRIAAYTRISVDTELDHENTSIENQKAIISDYCKLHFPTSTVDFYEDRDRSGYTFDQRPGYMQLRPLIMSKQYDILILKDLSRFSRRTGKGLSEFEDIVETGVRIIAIGDDVDYPTSDDWMKIKLYFFVNEMPVTDTSKKVSSVIKNRQSKGEWICTVPYGYVMKNAKKGIFEVDEVAAPVVRKIFELYNAGYGYKKIARYLTEQHIPTPRMRTKELMELNGDECKFKIKPEWSIITIQEILSNDFYIGVLRQHKYRRTKINGSDVKTDESEHIIFENHHTAIVDYKVFSCAQENINQRNAGHYRGIKKYDTMYTGILFCGDCGSPMFSRSRPDLKPAYICGSYQKWGLKKCTSHHIRTETLDDVLKDYIRMVKENAKDTLEEINRSISNKSNLAVNYISAEKQLMEMIAVAKEELKAVILQKTRDIVKAGHDDSILEQMYDDVISDIRDRIVGYQNQLIIATDSANAIVKTNKIAKTVFEIFDDILNKNVLSKVDIRFIVDRIIIYNDHIDIRLKSDIDELLKIGDSKNFEEDTIGISSSITQSSTNRKDKVYCVNVIREGDTPLTTLTVLNFCYIMSKIANRATKNRETMD